MAVIPRDFLSDEKKLIQIGEIVEGEVGLEIDGEFYQDIDDKLFNHFREQNK